MEMKPSVIVAAAQYGVDAVGTWQRYTAKVATLAAEAAAQHAQVLVFPEYACLELASLFPEHVTRQTQAYLAELQSLLRPFVELHRELAARHRCFLLAPSFPVRLPDHTYRNRAFFCGPDGWLDYQDKLMMTRFEREDWLIAPGDEIKVFATPFGRMGVTICYDSEFPRIARAQVAAGANLLLAPSCTDTLAGYNRVKLGCRARALENQCYVAMAAVVGTTDWLDAFDVTVGAAGIFAPVDYGFPPDGVLAQGELNRPAWVTATLDLSAIQAVRHGGQVTNFRDWPRQELLAAPDEVALGWLGTGHGPHPLPAPAGVHAVANAPVAAPLVAHGAQAARAQVTSRERPPAATDASATG